MPAVIESPTAVYAYALLIADPESSAPRVCPATLRLGVGGKPRGEWGMRISEGRHEVVFDGSLIREAQRIDIVLFVSPVASAEEKLEEAWAALDSAIRNPGTRSGGLDFATAEQILGEEDLQLRGGGTERPVAPRQLLGIAEWRDEEIQRFRLSYAQ